MQEKQKQEVTVTFKGTVGNTIEVVLALEENVLSLRNNTESTEEDFKTLQGELAGIFINALNQTGQPVPPEKIEELKQKQAEAELAKIIPMGKVGKA